MTTAPWRDPALPAAARVDDLLGRMTLEEKTAQLYGVWVGAATDGDGVAPLQSEMTADYDWDELITHGLGQLTRSYGTAPVDPALGAQALARAQRRIAEAGRFGIPAMAHEECLAGFTAWRATAYPVPLAWGAEAFARITGKEPFLTADALRMSRYRMFFSSEKARRELGYIARPYQEGLKDALTWFRDNGYLK